MFPFPVLIERLFYGFMIISMRVISLAMCSILPKVDFHTDKYSHKMALAKPIL